MLGFLVGLAHLLCLVPLAAAIFVVSRKDDSSKRRKSLSWLVPGGLTITLGALVLLQVTLWWSGVNFEKRWFSQFELLSVYNTLLGAKIQLFVWGTIISGALLYCIATPVRWMLPKTKDTDGDGEPDDDYQILLFILSTVKNLIVGIAVLFFGWMSIDLWDEFLRYKHAIPVGETDPIFGRDIGYYMFELPFMRAVVDMAWWVSAVGLGIAVLYSWLWNCLFAEPSKRYHKSRRFNKEVFDRSVCLFGYMVTPLLLMWIWSSSIAKAELLFSSSGRVFGVSAVDQNVYLSSYNWDMFFLALVLVAAWFVSLVRSNKWGAVSFVGSVALLLIVSWGWGFGLRPYLYQKYTVDPAEYDIEAPYAEHAIAGTLKAYGLDDVEVKDYNPRVDLTAEDFENNAVTINSARLADWRAVRGSYTTRQALRPYYNFADVDVDRYMVDGKLRQVVLSLREVDLTQERVPENIKDGWNNRHLVYTHGMGVVLSYANEFDERKLPRMRINSIPATSQIPDIQPSEEGIYFGERAIQHVYVNTGLKEFHYPTGNQDAETKYEGPAGVAIESGFDKFAVAWKFDGWRTYSSKYLSDQSRVVCRRTIGERVNTLAPFLRLDEDPYPVITDAGRVVYIQDAYTVSKHYPYSQPLKEEGSSFHPEYLDGYNYIRNSVKVTMDTFTGEVKFYVFDEDCVVLKVWQKVFPDLFTPKAEMPEDLLRHARYAEDLLKCQTEIYATYHMEDTRKFISREGVWEVATEAFHQGSEQHVEPYSAIVQLPDEDSEEYLMMVQCTPMGKDNLAAWLAGRSSGEHYGKLIVYRMPLQSEVAGPQMIENFIDTKDEWSQKITLWNDNGSALLRGNLLTLPIAGGLVYVEPIYLQSDNDGAMPTLIRVVIGFGDKLAWGENLEQAKQALFGTTSSIVSDSGSITVPKGKELGHARKLLNEYFQLSGEGKPAEAGLKLQELQRYLNAPAPAESK